MEEIDTKSNHTGKTVMTAVVDTNKGNGTTSVPVTHLNITAELLDVFLYGKRKIQEINLEEAKRQRTEKKSSHKIKNKTDENVMSVWCEKCQLCHNTGRSCADPLNLLHAEKSLSHDIKLTYAVLSFPPEVQLCTSTIPGYVYGVCAKQLFPVGTWIGPFEGKRVEADKVNNDTGYIWEIYNDGKFSHFLDGNDESTSSWMRYIRCARHKGEQNMVVFQYGNNIYYRAVRDIAPGTELLVWYNNNYTQFLGVPIGLRNVPGEKKVESKPDTSTKTSVKQETFGRTKCDEVNGVNIKHGSPPLPLPSSTHPASQRIQTTNTTYCYGGTVNPAAHPYMQYMKVNQPRMTIDRRANGVAPPIFSQKSPTMPDSTIRAQYPPVSRQIHENSGEASGNKPSSSASSLFPEDNETEKGPWKCNRCNGVFDQFMLFEMHMCSKSPEKPYQCGHCSEMFTTPLELGHHMNSHSTSRPFKCGFCGRTFTGPVALNNHIHYTHSRNGRSFFCQNCGATFSEATQFSRHMRTPGECPMSMLQNPHEAPTSTTTPFTSTLTRG